MEILNNREIALIIWGCILLVWLVYKKNARPHLLNVLRIFFIKKIQIVFILIAIYTLLSIFVIHRLGFWQSYLIKDAIFWFLGTAFIMILKVNDFIKNPGQFKSILRNSFTFAVVLQFIVNKYTFGLLIEILLLPAISFITILLVITQQKEDTKPVASVLKFILAGIGFIAFIYALLEMINDSGQFLSTQNLLTFLLPILLTIAYIPLLYFIALYVAYENFFTYVNIWMSKRNKTLALSLKKNTLILCHINLAKLARFTNKEEMGKIHNLRNESELTELIQNFKNRKE